MLWQKYENLDAFLSYFFDLLDSTLKFNACNKNCQTLNWSGYLSLSLVTVEGSCIAYLIISEFEQGCGGVTTGGQDEDKRGTAVTVIKRLGQVKGRRFNELPSELLGHKVLDSRHDL